MRLHEDEEDRFQHEDAYRMDNGALTLTAAGAPGSNTNRVSNADVRAVFLDTEIRNGRWILTPGLRFEDIEMQRLDYSTGDPTRALGPTRIRESNVSVLIPGMGALFRINDDWRLLAGVHKGFNPPSPGSTAAEESSVNFEAGFRFDNSALSIESILFYNDYDNLVGTVTESTGGGGDIGDQFDGGAVRVNGLELSSNTMLSVGAFEIPLAVQYTWTQTAEFRSAFESGFEPWGDVEVGDELPYIPEHQLQFTTGLITEKWRLNIAANYVGDMRANAGQGEMAFGEGVESHVVWDLLANWNLNERLSTYIKVDNLLDETYVAARRPAGVRPGLPRTAYLGLNYRL